MSDEVLAWLLCRGKAGKTQQGRIETTENESFWSRDFHRYGHESQTFHLFPHRAALAQRLAQLQTKASLLLLAFVERNLEFFVSCPYKYIRCCKLSIMLILGHNYPNKQTHCNHIYLVIYVSLFVPDTSFSRVRLYCIANICSCCLNPF